MPFEKARKPLFYLSYGKIVGQTGFLALVRQLVLKENFDFVPALLNLKTDLASHPTRDGMIE